MKGALPIFRLTDKSKNGVFRSVKYILDRYSIKYTNDYLFSFIYNHGDYPSMLTIRDTLDVYNIQSIGIRANGRSISDFGAPFICSIKDSKGTHFIVVTHTDSASVSYIDMKGPSERTLSIKEFKQILVDNTVLLIDLSNAEAEPNYRANLVEQKRRLILSIISLLFLITFIIFYPAYLTLTYPSDFTWINLCFFVTSGLGVLITILLFWSGIDSSNPFIKEICGKSEKKDCEAVINSKTSTFLGINWTLWGFTYFCSIAFSHVFLIGRSGLTEFWIVTSFLVSPYIFYSVFVQWRIVKKWCTLCLITQGILALNLFFSFLYIQKTGFQGGYDFQLVVLLIVSSVSTLLISKLFEHLFKENIQNRYFKMQWEKLRLNPVVFYSIIDKGAKVEPPSDELCIVIGNVNAGTEILEISNPFCEFCIHAHNVLKKIMSRNPDVRLKIIFRVNGNAHDIRTQVIARILSIFEQDGAERGSELLDYWFSDVDPNKYRTLNEKFPVAGDFVSKKIDKINEMKNWCDSAHVFATPTIFINGKKLPDQYRVQDLNYLF